jgi:predicted DsbA family dithiol-disulfide isomerase
LRQEFELEIEHCAFELHPGIPLEGQPVPWRPGSAPGARSQFEQAADAEGLPHGPRTHWYNSTPAHEAALWADEHANGDDFRRAVYRAYFVDNLNIGSADVLSALADQLRLDSQALRAALDEGRYREQVQEQFEYARAAGITGVPSYVAGRYVMVGAQPYEIFQRLIEAADSDGETESAPE